MKNNIKKALSCMLCLALMLGLFQVPFSIAAEINSANPVIFVDQTSGSDEKNGTSKDTAVQTLTAAFALLDGYTDALTRTVKIVGTYVNDGIPSHSKMTIIEGYDDTALFTRASTYSTQGPITFNLPCTFTNSWQIIQAKGKELVLGEKFTLGNNGYIFLGGYDENVGFAKLTVNCASTNKFNVWVGSKGNTAERTVAGADITINSGAVELILGSEGSSSVTKYTDNVTITLNGGTTTIKPNRGGGNTYSKAFTLICNNGASYTVDKTITAADGVWRMNVAEKEGCSISATDTVGTFAVSGGMAIASDGTNSYTSENGLLTVPAGTYTVAFPDADTVLDAVVYVDQANGNDENDGTSSATAVKTIAQAFTLLDGYTSALTRTVKFIGTYDSEAIPTHTQMTIFAAGSEDALFTRSVSSFGTNGPLTLNLPCSIKAWNQLRCQGEELVLGENFTQASDMLIYLGRYNGNSNETKLTVNTNEENFVQIYAGSGDNTAIRYIHGSDITINSGYVKLIYGANNSSDGYVNEYDGDVKLTVNGGNVEILPHQGGAGATYTKSFQAICNNGVEPSWRSNITADGGVWILNAEANGTSALQFTGVVGTYDVEGDLVAVASDGNNTYLSKDGTLTVPAGTYNVEFLAESVIYPTIYVDQTNGSDENDGTAEATAVKTLSAAFAALEACTEAVTRTAKIVGTYELDGDIPACTTMMIIAGADSSAVLTKSDSYAIQGPVTLDLPCTFATTYQKIMANNNELVLGENFTQTSDTAIWLGSKDADTTLAKLTVNCETTDVVKVWVGSGFNNEQRTVAGADITVNSGNVELIFGSESGTASNEYTENVNITLNGGNTTIKPNRGGGSVFTKAFQIIRNNGITETLSFNSGETSITATGGVYTLNVAETEGSAIEFTDIAGEFAVEGELVAIATGVDNENSYMSGNGVLKIQEAGEYDIAFSENSYYFYMDEETVYFNQDTVGLDLRDLKSPEQEGKLFVGWVDDETGEPATGTDFAADTVLYAEFIDYSATQGGDFALNSVSIKTDGQQGIRFVIEKSNALLENGVIEIVECGTLVMPSALLGNTKCLTYGTTYTYDSKTYTPATVVDDDEIVYETASDRRYNRVVLGGITADNFSRDYTARGYIKYTDINGFEKILYTDECVSTVYTLAKSALESENIMEAEKTFLEQIVNDTKAAYFAQEKIDIVGSSADPTTWIYQLGENGVMVREAEFDFGMDETVEIIQFSDTHFNYCNEKDMLEANPALMSTYANRKWLANGASVANARKCMEYASFFNDQTIITGDAIDYLSWGSLELLQRVIWNKDPNVLVTIGNHEFSRKVQGTVEDTTTIDSRYEILQNAWKHNVYYTSKIFGDKFMMIQMDNGQMMYTEEQYNLLLADIESARTNGYKILLFQHIALCTRNPEETAVMPIRDNDGSGAIDYSSTGMGTTKATGYTKSVCDLIRASYDVIEGVFCRHEHSDYYTEIFGHDYDDATGDYVDNTAEKIPQYILTAAAYDNGHVFKITIK